MCSHRCEHLHSEAPEVRRLRHRGVRATRGLAVGGVLVKPSGVTFLGNLSPSMPISIVNLIFCYSIYSILWYVSLLSVQDTIEFPIKIIGSSCQSIELITKRDMGPPKRFNVL